VYSDIVSLRWFKGEAFLVKLSRFQSFDRLILLVNITSSNLTTNLLIKKILIIRFFFWQRVRN